MCMQVPTCLPCVLSSREAFRYLCGFRTTARPESPPNRSPRTPFASSRRIRSTALCAERTPSAKGRPRAGRRFARICSPLSAQTHATHSLLLVPAECRPGRATDRPAATGNSRARLRSRLRSGRTPARLAGGHPRRHGERSAEWRGLDFAPRASTNEIRTALAVDTAYQTHRWYGGCLVESGHFHPDQQ